MKNLVLYITNQNWCEIMSGDWEKTEWKIYDDYSVEIKVSYVPFGGIENYKEFIKTISKEKYEELMNYIEQGKSCDEKITACDGQAWSYAQYSNNEKIWERELGYIYGIKPFEECAELLRKIR